MHINFNKITSNLIYNVKINFALIQRNICSFRVQAAAKHSIIYVWAVVQSSWGN